LDRRESQLCVSFRAGSVEQTVAQFHDALLESETMLGFAIDDELEIDEVLVPAGYGQPAAETLEMMHRFSEKVMPHFRAPSRAFG
jgi:hypothetical protein